VTDSGYLRLTPTITRTGPWVPTLSGLIGFAVRMNLDGVPLTGIPQNSSLPEGLVVVMEGADYHIKLQPSVDGRLKVWRNMGVNNLGLLGESAAGVLQSNVWAYIEFHWAINLTAGTGRAIVRVNGTTVIDFTGDTFEADLAMAGSGYWTDVRLLSVQSNVPGGPVEFDPGPYLTIDMCDLYLADLTAPLPNDVHGFMGDGSVQTILPTGVGAAAAWVPNVSVNWDAVNEAVPDDDTTFVSTATIGAVDTYAFGDLSGVQSVAAAQVSVLARMSTGGSATLEPLVRQGGINYAGVQRGITATAYDRFALQPMDVNPATTVPFTVDEINLAEFGVRRAG
jgi:hypothetical protein